MLKVLISFSSYSGAGLSTVSIKDILRRLFGTQPIQTPRYQAPIDVRLQ